MIGPNGYSIFMPAAFYEDNEPEYQWLGAYFSCTKDENDIKNVYTFVFAPNTKEKSINPMIRDSVCLVRPVYDEKNEYMSDGIRFGDNVTFNIIYGPKNEEESDEEETDSNSDGPYLITNNCVACGICIDECPVGAISEGDIYVIDGDTCVRCGVCASVCPNDAIEF